MFCVDLKTKSDYFLYNINGLVFITNTKCVYCAVRKENLYIIQKINRYLMLIKGTEIFAGRTNDCVTLDSPNQVSSQELIFAHGKLYPVL